MEELQGEESLTGRLLSAGPMLELLDIFGCSVLEKYVHKRPLRLSEHSNGRLWWLVAS